MIHLTQRLKIALKQNVENKNLPQNMSFNRLYDVVGEKTRKVTRKTKEGQNLDDEDLFYAYIADDYQLRFVASYNCYTVIDLSSDEEREKINQETTDNFYRWLNKLGFKTPGIKNEN